MLENTFKTYKKSKKIKITYSGVLLFGLLISPLFLMLNEKYITDYHYLIQETFRTVSLGIVVLFFIKYITSYSEKQKLRGEITGNLEIFTDKIKIGNKTFLLKDIKKIHFHIQDYEYRKDMLLAKTALPKISNGFNNLLEIELLNNEKIKIYFQQKYKNEFSRKNKVTLIEYYRRNKIPFLNLLEIFQISEYEEIQDFKQTIANSGSSQITGNQEKL